jgi:hypothetical protein
MKNAFDRYEDWCFRLPTLLGFFMYAVLPVLLYLIVGALIFGLIFEGIDTDRCPK